MLTFEQLNNCTTNLRTTVETLQRRIASTIYKSAEANNILELSEKLIMAQAKLERLQSVINKLSKSERYEQILRNELRNIYKNLASNSRYEPKTILIMKAEVQIIEIILN